MEAKALPLILKSFEVRELTPRTGSYDQQMQTWQGMESRAEILETRTTHQKGEDH